MKKAFGLLSKGMLLLAVGVVALSCGSEPAGEIHVAKYKGDREAAVSYTFDDGLIEHYTVLYPELRKRDIKATFWVNGNTINIPADKQGEKPRVSWEQLAEMAKAGQEVSNHGWSHKNLTKLEGEDLRHEVQHNDTVIWSHTGVFPRTFCYAGNRMDERTIEFASQGRVGTRTEQVAVGSSSTRENLAAWIDSLLVNGEWGVGMSHGISYGYDAFTDPQILWDHFDHVFGLKGRLWIATFHDVAAYIAERDNVTLNITREGDIVMVEPVLTLDKEIFNYPLSLVVPTKNNDYVVALQDGRSLKGERREGCTVFDFNPHGGAIKIYMSLPDTPPEDVNSDMNYYNMLNQLGVKMPILPAPEADPNRVQGIPPMVEKPGRWKAPDGDERRRSNWGLWTNYDDKTYGFLPGADSARVGDYTPIDLLKDKKGRTITTAQEWWEKQRPAIAHAVQEEILGFMPDAENSPKVTFTSEETRGESGGYAYVQQVVKGEVDCSSYPELRNKPTIELTLRTPAEAEGPVPVMIVFGGGYAVDMYWTIMAEQGWGVCIYNPNSVQPDSGDYLTNYLIGLLNKGDWREPTDIGALGAWAWGVSRAVDYLQSQPTVMADGLGVTGHSRYGKGAFYAMAFDERIAIAFPSDAGSLGTAMNRRHIGEDLEVISSHWPAGNIMRFFGPLNEGEYMPRKVENMTADAHSVLALCAPRPVFINSGSISLWADPYGMFLTTVNASPVYELLGVKGLDTEDKTPVIDKAYIGGNIGYRLHEGGHVDYPDWPSFFEFARKFIEW
ncbi:MAG: polysaccharide deacetylase family protein [Tidjanibacter sp.]|nr:polysaccharide deacetylase family protein [Tidjanibacter sp.]